MSYSHGDENGQSFCGTRTYALLTPFPWATFDITNGQLQVSSTDASLVGSTPQTVTVEISLTDYPGVKTSISVDIEFIKSCNDAVMTTTGPAGQTFPYFTWDSAVSAFLSDTITGASIDVIQDCGIFGVSFFSDAAGTLPLDSTIFSVVG